MLTSKGRDPLHPGRWPPWRPVRARLVVFAHPAPARRGHAATAGTGGAGLSELGSTLTWSVFWIVRDRLCREIVSQEEGEEGGNETASWSRGDGGGGPRNVGKCITWWTSVVGRAASDKKHAIKWICVYVHACPLQVQTHNTTFNSVAALATALWQARDSAEMEEDTEGKGNRTTLCFGFSACREVRNMRCAKAQQSQVREWVARVLVNCTAEEVHC